MEVLVFRGSRTRFENYLKKNDIDPCVEDDDSGCTIWKKDPFKVFVWVSNNDVHILVHELLHATHAIMSYVGIPKSSEEFQAYMLDFLTRKALKK